MKMLENSSDAQIDALYTTGSALKLQRNGSRGKEFNPKPNTHSKKSDGKKSCVWYKEDVHSVTSFQLRMQFVNSVANRDILNGHMRQEE